MPVRSISSPTGSKAHNGGDARRVAEMVGAGAVRYEHDEARIEAEAIGDDRGDRAAACRIGRADLLGDRLRVLLIERDILEAAQFGAFAL